MKKNMLILVFLFVFQVDYANTSDPLLSQAKEYSLNENYSDAIKMYKEYLNNTDDLELKNVYIEMANCFFKIDDKDSAIKYIKKAITKYGFNEEDFIYNNVLDSKLSKYALSVFYDDLDSLYQKYNATLN